MSASASGPAARRPQLRLVQTSLQPVGAAAPHTGWRRVAAAIIASTWDASRHLGELRFGRVHEELGERRELLELMRTLPLDAHGRSCLRALEAAALESECAIAAMTGKSS